MAQFNPDGEAPAKLLSAMKAIEEAKKPGIIDPIMYELLHRVGKHKGGVTGFVLRTKPLVNAFVKPKLMQRPPTRSVLTNTAHLTGSGGGAGEPIVVPSEAWAQYDCRLLPGVTAEEQLVQRLRDWTAHLDGITIRSSCISTLGAKVQSMTLYLKLSQNTPSKTKSNAVAAPCALGRLHRFSFARQRGVHAYGYAPSLLTVDEAVRPCTDTMNASLSRTCMRAYVPSLVSSSRSPPNRNASRVCQ